MPNPVNASSEPVKIAAIPEELKARHQWVCWRWALRDGKPTKEPVRPGLPARRASVTTPAMWATFAACRASLPHHAGLGFVFCAEDPYCGIDLDNCRDPATGEIDAWAWEWIIRFATYAEVSPSGTGVKLFGRAALADGQGHKRTFSDPGGSGRVCAVEWYDRARYFTVTGWRIEAEPVGVAECGKALALLVAEFTKPEVVAVGPRAAAPPQTLADGELLERARGAANGARFAALYDRGAAAGGYLKPDGTGDGSAADLALCNMLAFWCGGDAAQLDRLFRGSALYRVEKWGKREDYRASTMGLAIRGCREYYTGGRAKTERPVTERSIHARPPRSGPSGGGSGLEPPPDDLEPAKERQAAGERLTDLTDLGNGQRFARMHGDKARFCLSHAWLIYDGSRWEANRLLAQELGKEISRELWRTLLNVHGNAERAAHFKWAQRSESNASIQACLTMASSEDGIRIDGNDLDQQPWLFNCNNGAVDLRTGELLKHDPEHLITHLSPVNYRPEASCPLFLEFMDQIVGGSQPMVDYLQEWLGQCLSGSTALQELLMCIGNGANGKNTMLNAVLGVMGSYGGVTPADFLLIRKNDAHSQEIVMLKGKRLLLADEADQGRVFNEGLIKQFTGGSPLKGHLMGMNDITFRPEFKVVLLANHKPIIKGTDDGIWRRPPVAPFNVKFHDPTDGVYPVKDLALERKLASESEGILAWLVRGCLRWVANDLAITRPPTVVAATREYREEMDVLGTFIADRCDQGPLLKVKASHLYKAWEMWVGSRGSMSLVAFADQMKRRGYVSERKRDGVFYSGLDVRDEAFSESEDWRTK